MSSGTDFKGITQVEHVLQPEGSELCFASIISSITGASVEVSHAALRGAGLSKEDGSTSPMPGEQKLEVAGSFVTIEPLDMPEDPQEAMGIMDGRFATGEGVALMYKKLVDPENSDYHWSLLTGYCEHDGNKGPIYVIDPLETEAGYVNRNMIEGAIQRSVDYTDWEVDPPRIGGFYAHVLSVK